MMAVDDLPDFNSVWGRSQGGEVRYQWDSDSGRKVSGRVCEWPTC